MQRGASDMAVGMSEKIAIFNLKKKKLYDVLRKIHDGEYAL